MKRVPLLALVWVVVAGCQTAPRPSPGLAGLHVKVIAEPKVGVKMPGQRVQVYDTGGSDATDLGSGAFERVDYAALDEIVVWAEPADATQGPVTTPPAPIIVSFDPKKPATALAGAASVGQRIIVVNKGAAGNLYSVSDGNEFDLGVIPPGGRAEYTVRAAGLIELLSDASRDPAAQVYAAPTRWVAVGRAGAAVDFNNLPPGPCKVQSWHPRLPGYLTTVTLPPDQVTTTSIKVGVNALPKVGR